MIYLWWGKTPSSSPVAFFAVFSQLPQHNQQLVNNSRYSESEILLPASLDTYLQCLLFISSLYFTIVSILYSMLMCMM
jgi:hypothetical protein